MKTPISDTPAPGPGELYDTLEAMVASLARIEAAQGQTQAQAPGDLGMLLADMGAMITEAVGVMHSQMSDVLLGIQDLQHPAAPQPPARRPWLSYGLGALAGIVVMGAVWYAWPESAYSRFAVALDTTLAQHYGQLSKSAQEALDALYKRHGFQSPATRVKGAK